MAERLGVRAEFVWKLKFHWETIEQKHRKLMNAMNEHRKRMIDNTLHIQKKN
jgi:hypothetical protein